MKTKKKIEANQQKKKRSKVKPLTVNSSSSSKLQQSHEAPNNVRGRTKSDGNPHFSPTSRNLKSGHLDLSQFSGFIPPDNDPRAISIGNDIRHLEYTRHYQSTTVNPVENKTKGLTTSMTPFPWHSRSPDHDLVDHDSESLRFIHHNPHQTHLALPPDNNKMMMANDRYPRVTVDTNMNPTSRNAFTFSPTNSLRIDDKFSPISVVASFTSSSSNESENCSLKSTYIELNDDNFPGIKGKVPHNSFEYSNEQSYRSRTQNNAHHDHDHIHKRPCHHHRNRPHKDAAFNMEHKSNHPKSVDRTTMDIILDTLIGNSPFVQEFLDRKQHQVEWSLIVLLEIFFRSIALVSLSSNVLTGLIIFITAMIVSPFSTLLGVLALLSGTLTSIFILQIPLESLRSGVILFNSFLIGSSLEQLSSTIKWAHAHLYVCLTITFLAGSAVIFIWYGLEGLFKRLRLPQLNFAFNLLALLFLKGILESYKSPTSNYGQEKMTETLGISSTTNNFNNEHFGENHINHTTSELNFKRVFEGILLAPSHFYPTKTLWSSTIVYMSWLIFSPVFTFQAIMGATMGNLIGILLTPEHNIRQYSLIYDGSWAYNSLLTSVAIGLFYVFNLKCWIMSIVGSSLTALVFAAMTKAELPVFGIPFMLVTQLLMSSSNNNIQSIGQQKLTTSWMLFLRIDQVTTPEIHLKKIFKQLNKSRPKIEKKSNKPLHPLPLELHV